MIAIRLIQESQKFFEMHPQDLSISNPFSTFSKGAKWLGNQARKLNSTSVEEVNTPINYSFYGYLKYGLSLAVFALFLYIGLTKNVLFLLTAPFAFYLVEVHFLFLFPSLLHEKCFSLFKSIQLVYSVGFLTCYLNTLIIAAWMIIGLFNTKNPLKNWLEGCLAVLIWYNEKTRNRS